MSIICECGSTNVKNNGVRLHGKKRLVKYTCMECQSVIHTDFLETKDIVKQNLVITSATDSFEINDNFLTVLGRYCKANNAKLIILPVNNKLPFNENKYSDSIKPYLCYENLEVGGMTKIMGGVKLGTTLESPLHGLNSFSKGKNVIFGHPQVQLKTLPRKTEKYPAIITTTGSISVPNYSENKTAHKANFNHSYSALFISGKNPNVMRHLNFDGVGFYDLDAYYDETGVHRNKTVSAIVTGDEHVMFYDEEVYDATYGDGGMVSKLKPEYIVRHDVLDCYSISHHHVKNVFTRYGKYLGGMDSIEDELEETLTFISDTTPKNSTSIIVSSNHNSHLFRWLNEADPKQDMVNAKLYHQMMYLMLDEVTVDGSISYPDPFELWCRDKSSKNITFLKASEEFYVHEIDINNHGDLGLNGTRGTRLQYKDVPSKTIIGHSHSPGIEKGSYQVGTSSKMRLDYNKGLSTWHHAHCLIHKNGKRQLIFIVDGEWK